jgi:hypothetical protein
MNCPSCKKEMPAGAARCPSCGWVAPLAGHPQWSSRPPACLWWAFGCCALVGLGLFGCCSLFFIPALLGFLAAASGRSESISTNGSYPWTGKLTTALSRYADDHHDRYPASLEQLLSPGKKGGRYFADDELPLDSWDRDLECVLSQSDHACEIRVLSLGADGAPGGTDEDADREIIRMERRTGPGRH